MAATYDPTLPSDKDWVRLLIGDTDVSSPVLSDEEILGIIAEEVSINGQGIWTKYLVAARAGWVILAADGGSGSVVSKTVGNLSLSYGGSSSADSAFRAHLQSLKERGAVLLLRSSGSHLIRTL